MARGVAAFATGLLQGGLGGYQLARGWRRQDERDARELEKSDIEIANLNREAEAAKAKSAEQSALAQMLKTGEVPGHDPYAPVLVDGGDMSSSAIAKGIQKAPVYDVTARPTDGTALPATPARPAEEADYRRQAAVLSAYGGDTNTAIAYQQQVQQAEYDKADTQRAMAIAQDPTGKDASQLLQLLSKTEMPGIKTERDPATGVYFLTTSDSAGKPKKIELTGPNLMQLSIAHDRLMRGDPRALEAIAAIDSGLAAQTAAGYKMQVELAKLNTDAAKAASDIGSTAIQSGIRADQNIRDSDEHEAKMADRESRGAETQEQREALARVAQEQGASQAVVDAVRKGAMAVPGVGGDDNAPAKVKLARELFAAGVAPSMDAALERAMQLDNASPAMVYQKVLTSLMTDPLMPKSYADAHKIAVQIRDAYEADLGRDRQGGQPSESGQAGANQPVEPNPAQIRLLRKRKDNPKAIRDFEAMFGPGSAKQYLQGK